MLRIIESFRRSPKAWIVFGLCLVVIVSVVLAKSPRMSGGDAYSERNMDVTSARGGYLYDALDGDKAAPSVARAPMPMGVPMEESGMMPPFQPTAGETAANVDQKIIKNGYLHLMVQKVAEAASRVTEIAARRGGYVQSSSISERGDGTYQGDIAVRVPTRDFEATMAEIKGLATLVKSDTATGQDVTEQYTDLEARLKNARAQEETYLAILQRANTVEDILKVQDRLGSIRAEIESFQGRIQYLENVTSYSTVTVSLTEETSVHVPSKSFRPLVAAREAFQTLVTLFQQLVLGAIWFVIVWIGALLPVIVVAYVVWRLIRRYRRRT